MATLSREVLAIEAYMQATGVPHAVTATLGTYLSPANPCSPHSPASLHCAAGTDGQGRAVDLADAIPSGSAAALLKVFAAFGPVETKLAELICAAAPYCIHNGVRVNGWAVYGTAVMNEHWTHVHVGVPLGTFLAAGPAPTPGVKPMYSPPLGPIAAAWLDDQGRVISAADPDGHVFWGKWWGNTAGKPYWAARKVALIGARPDGQPGYRITATDGATYDLPDGLDKLS